MTSGAVVVTTDTGNSSCYGLKLQHCSFKYGTARANYTMRQKYLHLYMFELLGIYILMCLVPILLIKTTAAQNAVALSYYTLRGLYFLAVVFVRSIVIRE